MFTNTIMSLTMRAETNTQVYQTLDNLYGQHHVCLIKLCTCFKDNECFNITGAAQELSFEHKNCLLRNTSWQVKAYYHHYLDARLLFPAS